MFWNSFLQGLQFYQHTEVWTILVILIVVNLVLLFGFGFASGNGDNGGRQTLGCFGYVVIASLANCILLPFAITYLTPVFLHLPMPDHFISIILGSWWSLLIVGGIALIATWILGVIPVIGHVFDYPGVDRFMQLVIIFSIGMHNSFGEKIQLPSFWISLAFVVVTAAIAWIILLLTALVSTFIHEGVGETIGTLFGLVSGYFVAFTAFFMYVEYFLALNTF